MNKRNIGSKQAEKLAREKFGEKTYVSRYKKTFAIGVRFAKLGSYIGSKIIGCGKSWELALRAAGVEIPEDVEVTEKPEPVPLEELTTILPLPDHIHLLGTPSMDIPDNGTCPLTVPEDTDAKEEQQFGVGV